LNALPLIPFWWRSDCHIASLPAWIECLKSILFSLRRFCVVQTEALLRSQKLLQFSLKFAGGLSYDPISLFPTFVRSFLDLAFFLHSAQRRMNRGHGVRVDRQIHPLHQDNSPFDLRWSLEFPGDPESISNRICKPRLPADFFKGKQVSCFYLFVLAHLSQSTYRSSEARNGFLCFSQGFCTFFQLANQIVECFNDWRFSHECHQ